MTCDSAATIPMTRGGDQTFAITWGGATPINATGYDIEVFEPHSSLVGQVAASWVDITQGRISVTITWADDIPVGKIASFRLRLVPAPGYTLPRKPTPAIFLDVT